MKNRYISAALFPIRRISVVGLHLALALSLGACSQDGAMPVGEAVDANEQITNRPSVSAAELSNDGVNSISFAQAVAAGVVARPQPIVTGEPQTSAATPVAGNPLALLPVSNTTNASLSAQTPVTDTVEIPAGNTTDNSTNGSVGLDESGSSATAEPDEISNNVTNEPVLTANTGDSQTGSPSIIPIEAGSETETETETETVTDAGNVAVDTSEAAGDAATSFSSYTSPGFNGEVLDDSIRVTWTADPDARGYNVYRQAEFVTTVFSTEYIDNDVYDQDYYYEIQAFDHSDTLYYIATGLTVSARTLGRTDPDAPKPNADLLKDYELVFADEFNTNTLDATKWNTSYLWGDDLVINSEEQHYVDVVNEPDFGFNPFTFDGNNLTINSIKTPPELLAKANNQPYLSGVITSYDAFKFTYGYIETRAKVTHGRGYWPAFWLLNAYYVDDKPEIDIMEFIGHNQDVVYHTYHYYDSSGNLRSTKSKPTPGIDYTNDFHTYAAEWKPGTIVFYVDGIEVHRIIDAKVSRQDMYVIANTALGGWWAGSPDSTTPFPGKFTLDYIRVYQKNLLQDDFLFDDGPSNVPLADDIPGQRSPNHRPTPEQWPEGYPDGL